MQTTVDNNVHSHGFCHAVCWKSIIAGAVTAAVVSLILLAFGSGIGIASMSPYSGDEGSIAGFTAKMAIWMIVMQWLSAAFGGYLAGRLRKKHFGIHDDEAFFRDTAHGFLTWAVATVITAVLLTSAAASVVSGGAKMGAMLAGGAAAGAGKEMAAHHAGPGPAGGPMMEERGYYIDTLFRGAAPAQGPMADNSQEVSRIFMVDMKADSFPDEDKQYLAQLVASRTGVSQEEASARVNTAIDKLNEEKAKAKEAADKARKASASFAIFTALSMLVGAFIAAVAAAIGGGHRELHKVI